MTSIKPEPNTADGKANKQRPINATMEAMTRPAPVFGLTSPYPTVVMVIALHHNALDKELNSGYSFSTAYIIVALVTNKIIATNNANINSGIFLFNTCPKCFKPLLCLSKRKMDNKRNKRMAVKLCFAPLVAK